MQMIFQDPQDSLNPRMTVGSIVGDPAVRRALSLAIDRSILVDFGYGAAGQVACNVLPAPPVYASTANDACMAPDIEEANRILDEAGWLPGDDGVREKDGVRLSILYQTSTNSVRQGTQALVKQMWGQIGVETELRNIDAAVFFGGDPASPDTYMKFYADIQMYTNNFDGVDPEAYMANWTCSEIPGPENQWLGGNIARLQRRVRRPRRRDGRDRLAGGTRRHRQADERHRRPEPVCDPAHLAREDFGACEHAEGRAHEPVGFGALERGGLAPLAQER